MRGKIRTISLREERLETAKPFTAINFRFPVLLLFSEIAELIKLLYFCDFLENYLK